MFWAVFAEAGLNYIVLLGCSDQYCLTLFWIRPIFSKAGALVILSQLISILMFAVTDNRHSNHSNSWRILNLQSIHILSLENHS